MNIPGNELEPGIFIGGARVVFKGDPAAQFAFSIRRIDKGHIFGMPFHPLGQIADLALLSATGPAIQQPDQSRSGDQSSW